MKSIAILLLVLLLALGCNVAADEHKKNEDQTGAAGAASNGAAEAQLNINVLWDLSDRIDPALNPASPPHYERDIEAIKTIASFFKKDMEKRGAFKAKGKMKVFFTPPPANPRINQMAAELSCDLAAYTGDGANRKKKEWHDSIESRFARNAAQIYQAILAGNKNAKGWDGSDIWRFFKNDVKEYCIEPSPGYRNILVLLTDGYLYHKDSKTKQGNRTTYLLPEVLKPLRQNAAWQTSFKQGDFGLLSTRSDLQNLEVLVLEITPSKDNKNDEDLIKAYLGKWFEEMGVAKANYALYNTDLPEYSKKKIETFFNR